MLVVVVGEINRDRKMELTLHAWVLLWDKVVMESVDVGPESQSDTVFNEG